MQIKNLSRLKLSKRRRINQRVKLAIYRFKRSKTRKILAFSVLAITSTTYEVVLDTRILLLKNSRQRKLLRLADELAKTKLYIFTKFVNNIIEYYFVLLVLFHVYRLFARD